MSLSALYKELKYDLNDIETQLEQAVAVDEPILRQAAFQLLKAGGKRIRPMFVLLSANYGDASREDIKKVAVTLELIHSASLVHDDVIDNAELRRGKQTVKARWDNRVAMYTGDFLFARALEIVGEVRQKNAHTVLSKAFMDMCLGEIVQIEDQYNWQQNFRNYLLRIKRKTALLMAVSCHLGAVAAGAPNHISDDLYRYGYYIGMSYQIIDDILDFVGTEKQLGKPAGGDLRQGNVTLPTLLALKNPEIKGSLYTCLKAAEEDPAKWDSAIAIIRASGAIEASRTLSDRYLNKAYQILKRLPSTHTTRSLGWIADSIGKRKF
ncbi:heptaprenyl diphosphate synthase component II [Camelliibacillus cellulosilyticus]|uniref:Heptaprenyl diphosphate synthase component II n=1 Tax=Camelliibacillus cellulosilyticus TaxID=2174486 RepID=A0ABV9GKU4_9BACL